MCTDATGSPDSLLERVQSLEAALADLWARHASLSGLVQDFIAANRPAAPMAVARPSVNSISWSTGG